MVSAVHTILSVVWRYYGDYNTPESQQPVSGHRYEPESTKMEAGVLTHSNTTTTTTKPLHSNTPFHSCRITENHTPKGILQQQISYCKCLIFKQYTTYNQARILYLVKWRSGVRIATGQRKFSPHQNILTSSGAHKSSHSVGIGFLFQAWSGQYVKLTNHLNLVPSIRISGGKPPLPYMPSWREQGQLPLALSLQHQQLLCQ